MTAVCPVCEHSNDEGRRRRPWWRVGPLRRLPVGPVECGLELGSTGWGDPCPCRDPFHGQGGG